MRYRSIGVMVMALCLVFTVGVTLFSQSGTESTVTPYTPLPAAPQVANPLAGIDETSFSVGAAFSTHLPIVVIDTGDERPPITTKLLNEENRFVTIEGIEPYVYGTVSVIDTGDINTLDSPATITSRIALRRRGNSSMGYQKAHYLLKTLTQSGQDNAVEMLGMPAESEWVLNGNMADKSMIRNYVGYTIAREFIPYTPRIRYCELLYKEGGEYIYEGIYTIIESVRQGPERVDIPEYKPNDAYPSYMVRRDRLDESGAMLHTYLTESGQTNTYVELRYPGTQRQNEELIQYVQDDISRIERVLYSDDNAVFSSYSRYIDVPLFIDYFLFNEFMGNYDAGAYSTYMYKSGTGRLAIGPVWDYDNAFDNSRQEALDYAVTAIQTKPWMERLMQDAYFLDQMQKRYAELRNQSLSEEHVFEVVENALNYLGPAMDREWMRWKHIYGTFTRWSLRPTELADGTQQVRDTDELRQELYRISTSITLHGRAISQRLEVLEDSTTMNSGWTSRMEWIVLLALLAFAIPAVYVTRR